LKEALHAIFDHYGPILDIVAKTSLKRKGQAFIVFDSQKSALQAIEEMSGFELYGKQMKVSLAKTHSDETLKRKATEEQFEQHKRERLTLKGMSPGGRFGDDGSAANLSTERKLAEQASKEQAATAVAKDKPRAVKTGAAAVPDEYVRPNKTLFLQNIPADVTQEDLSAIFERFDGFNEVRYIKIRAVGFAEFENEQFAITAKESTANMPIGADNKPMKVTYQRQ
jgi:RNA recognition motif-containing protein